MPADPVIHALGARIALDVGALSVAQRDEVRRTWEAAVAPAGPADLELAVDPAADTPRLLARLTQRVTRAAIDHRRGKGWMLHAGAIADEGGRVLVLVGLSGAGKTTAVRELGRRYAYVTDETVFLDHDGRVLPYRKPLSLVQSRRGPKNEQPPTSLGLDRPLPPELRVAGIVLLDRRPEASDPARLEAVDLGDALPVLVAQSSYLTAMTHPLRTIARHAAATGGVRRAVYREARDLAPLVDDLFAGTAGAHAVGSDSLPFSDDASAARPSVSAAPLRRRAILGDPRYRRRPVDDTLVLADPDRVAVLVGGLVCVLSGIAPAIWRAADDTALTDLVDAVVQMVPDPLPSDVAPALAVAQAAEELVATGVLEASVPGWTVRDDVAWTDDGRQVVAIALADWRRAHPLAIGGSGAAVWRALAVEPPSSTQTVAKRMARSVGVAPAEIRASVAAFLADLHRAGLVEVDEGASGSA